MLTRDDAGKISVPRRLRELLTPMIKRVRPLVIGGRYANDHRATIWNSITRKYSATTFTPRMT